MFSASEEEESSDELLVGLAVVARVVKPKKKGG